MKKNTPSPLMQQYHAIKAAYPGMIVLFQVGDFYELFFDDATTAAPILGVALTTRGEANGQPIPLCGVPLHVMQHYVPKLLQAGLKVAICEQLEPPAPGRIVKRGVTKVLTPGMLTDEGLLEARKSAYLTTLSQESERLVCVHAELLTGTLIITELDDQLKAIETELQTRLPQEVVITQAVYQRVQPILQLLGICNSIVELQERTSEYDAWLEQLQESERLVCHSQALQLMHFYVSRYMPAALPQLTTVHMIKQAVHLQLDAATQRNLELVANTIDGTKRYTLFEHLDQCMTAMGSRQIRRWLMQPLAQKEMIDQRLQFVQALVTHVRFAQRVRDLLAEVGDLERAVGRMSLAAAHLTDYVHLRRSLAATPAVVELIGAFKEYIVPATLLRFCHDFTPLRKLLECALVDAPTPGAIIAPGYNAQLDELRRFVDNAQEELLAFEHAESDATGIPTLKVRPQTAHGYTIEITAQHKHRVPSHYRAVQTLTGRERYTTPALQELEKKITNAESEAHKLQQALYQELQQRVLLEIAALKQWCQVLAQLDAYCSFAHLAYTKGYVRPEITDDYQLQLDAAKHPIIAQLVGVSFVPNSTLMNEELHTYLLTGPNMGGKSTYLRQVALLCVMAHVGSFVPARRAIIPHLDAIFSRVGAGDRLAEGKSTFLVEMEETALICTLATKRSLVILDEVGRGTSTRDGLALAQAVVEYLHTKIRPLVLFATHYHELTTLNTSLPALACYHMACRKTASGLVFLHTLLPGAAGESFGLEVAQLAQLPLPVIERARQLMLAESVIPAKRAQEPQPASAIEVRLNELDIEQLTARQAFELVWELKNMMQSDS